jgi:hypothetical protein
VHLRGAVPAVLAYALGCTAPKASPSSSEPAPTAPAQAAPRGDAATEETREGTLVLSKGNPTIDGALLPHDLVKRALGEDWRRTALGKRVRARGTLRIHVCGLAEQCLSTGEIPFFDATSIELVDAP